MGQGQPQLMLDGAAAREARQQWFLRGRIAGGHPTVSRRTSPQKMQTATPTGTSQITLSAGPSVGTSTPLPPGNTNAAWTPVGPGPTATASSGNLLQDYGPAIGRVTAIAVDPNDASGNTVYAGGAYGGVWRSVNAANGARATCPNSAANCAPNVSWQPIMDDQPTLAVGAIAVKPGDANWILVGTGEANNAADSYYGLGFLLTRDGGQSWTLIDFADNGTNPLRGLGITQISFSTSNPNLVVATAAAANAALGLGAETGGTSARGIYYSTDGGQSWHRASVMDSATPVSPASANAVIYNQAAGKFYANLRFHGFYSSADGANWSRLPNQPGGSLLALTACPSSPGLQSCPLFRAQMAIVPGRNEMYAWIVDATDSDRGMFQSRDGGGTWSPVPNGGMTSNCGESAPSSQACGSAQGTYNLALAAVPNGSSTDLYAGAVNIFKCRVDVPSDTSSCNFVNLTHVYGCSPIGSYSHVHPDQHAIGFSQQHPEMVYFGNDGGIFRAPNSFAANSGSCANPPASQWFDNLNATMGSMLQFVSFSQHPTDDSIVLGGTQDNGSPATSTSSAATGTWLSVNQGDGGFNAINPADGNEWFTSLPGESGGGFGVDIRRCLLGINCTASNFFGTIGSFQTGGDSSSFYPPFLLDSMAPQRLMAGTCRVWRGNSDGSGANWGTPGIPLSINFDADPAGSASSTACSSQHTKVAALAAGGPVTSQGSQVVFAGLEGDTTVGSGGELWVTTSADAGPSTWKRALAANTACSGVAFNPLHYTVSDVALDVNDPTGRTAWVTVMGFTGGQSGHVFKVTVGDSTTPGFSVSCTDITGNLPDAPVNSVLADASDPAAVYVGTDAGVFVTGNAAVNAQWDEVGPPGGTGALPNVVVTRLRMFHGSGGNTLLRASTYGRGVWEAALTPDFRMIVTSTVIHTFTGVQKTFTGKLFSLAGYNHAVAISCDAAGGSTPATCTGGTSITPTLAGTPFSVTVSNPAVQDFSFALKAVGSDGATHSVAVTLNVGSFTLSGPVPSTLTAPHASPVDATVGLVPQGSVQATINMTCTAAGGGALPAGITCSTLPQSTALAGTSVNITVRVTAGQNVAAGVFNLSVTAAAADGSRTLSVPLTVGVAVNPRFEFQPFSTSLGTAKPGQPLSASIPVASLDGYPATVVQLTCVLGGNAGAATCSVAPSSINLAQGGTQSATISVNTQGAIAANTSITITGRDASTSGSATLNYSIQDFQLSTASGIALLPGGAGTGTASLISQNGYAGTVALNCTSAAFFNNPCTLTPSAPQVLTATTNGSVQVRLTAPQNTAAGSYTVRLRGNDTSLTSLIHDLDLPVVVYDFQLDPGTARSASVRAGQQATYNISVTTGAQGFPQKITFACSGLPQLASCQFSPTELPAGGNGGTVRLTISTTATTVAIALPPGSNSSGGLPGYALWVGVAAVIFGVNQSGSRRQNSGIPGLLTMAVVILLVALLIAGLNSCGGGGSSSSPTPPIPQPGTPSGLYTITVQGSSTGSVGAADRTAQVTLTVQ